MGLQVIAVLMQAELPKHLYQAYMCVRVVPVWCVLVVSSFRARTLHVFRYKRNRQLFFKSWVLKRVFVKLCSGFRGATRECPNRWVVDVAG